MEQHRQNIIFPKNEELRKNFGYVKDQLAPENLMTKEERLRRRNHQRHISDRLSYTNKMDSVGSMYSLNMRSPSISQSLNKNSFMRIGESNLKSRDIDIPPI